MHEERIGLPRLGSLSRGASRRVGARRALLLLWVSVFSLSVNEAGAAVASSLAGIPPGLLQQVRNMSPEQQRRLAAQYGVDLNSLVGASGGSALDEVGRRGEPISPATPDRDQRSDKPTPRELAAEKAASIKVRSLEPSERYGIGFFTSAVSSFEPVDNAPVPPDYRLGPGDSLNLLTIGTDNVEFEAVVDRDGSITFPQLGRIPLAGMAFEEASALIGARVAAQLIGVDVLVGMGRLRAINVTLAGEVRVPGSRSISSLARVTHALFAAGGLTEIGSLREIQVKRGGELVATFDVYDLLLRGDARNDVRLLDGDVVFVPPVRNMVGVFGEVRRPAVYETTGEPTLAEVIEMAGGATAQALTREILIERQEPDSVPRILSVSLDEASEAQPLLRGDRVRLLSNSDRFTNRVLIKGAAQRPGVFGYEDGMRVSDLIGDVDRDLAENVDYNYALVVSEDAVSGEISTRTFSVSNVIGDRGGESDPILQPRDQLLFFRNVAGEEGDSSMRGNLLAPVIARLEAQAGPDEPVRIVRVDGSVHAPGVYPLSSSMTIRDLVAAAGGMRDDAYVWEVELQRVVVSEDGLAGIRSQILNLGRAGREDFDIRLQSRDSLQIRTIPDFRPRDRIKITGEVRFPGSYLIAPGETVGDVVKRAGGFTPEAFPDGAVFTREQLRKQELEEVDRFVDEIRRNVAVSTLTFEGGSVADIAAIEQLGTALRESSLVGRMIIDLPEILNGGGTADFLLQDGDQLDIPKQVSTVTVIGEVQRPGSYRFQERFDVDDYLAISAGLTRRADDKRIYLLRANGEVVPLRRVSLWKFDQRPNEVRPGDTVVVPVDTTYRNSIDYWSQVTQIVYQAGVAVLAILQI